eukprot:c19510_g1_i2 orf=941-1192(+)
MANNNSDLFNMLPQEDKLNGDNYSMLSYMMRHVLVAKNVWVYVDGTEAYPLVVVVVSSTPVDGEIVTTLPTIGLAHAPSPTPH